VSIKTTLELWASSLLEVKARVLGYLVEEEANDSSAWPSIL
jgi:hypothetical protein